MESAASEGERWAELRRTDLRAGVPKNSPAWLTNAFLHLQIDDVRNKIPIWLVLEDLPNILVAGKRLNKDQLAMLVFELQQNTADQASPVVQELKSHCQGSELELFAQFILDSWIKDKAPNKDRWALFSAGYLGGQRH